MYSGLLIAIDFIVGHEWEGRVKHLIIQVIAFDEKESERITYSSIARPISLDEFDVNIIDLSSDSLWKAKDPIIRSIDQIQDLASIRTMVDNSTKSTMIFVLPQDVTVLSSGTVIQRPDGSKDTRYNDASRLKDKLPMLKKEVLEKVIPNIAGIEIIYENTQTTISGEVYKAAFYFAESLHTPLSKSDHSDKITTIIADDRRIITTLDITGSDKRIYTYLNNVIFPIEKEKEPEWIHNVVFWDDEKQREIITKNVEIIKNSQELINRANEKLQENAYYKSILYSTGDELVKVVFKILSDMLDYDLNDFIDEKKEDFRICKDRYTLIGEIKGINTNVRNENVSQTDVHYQRYIDKLDEEEKKENVYQVLIINPLRKTPLDNREAVHTDQIELAERNGCLIIETKTLLKMYEKFRMHELSVIEIEEMLIERTGLMKI